MTSSLMKRVVFDSPPQYKTVDSYRSYLRKVFNYSCAYCTTTEAETRGATFHIDHFKPKALFPELETECTNLRYACPRCNSYKRDRWMPPDSGCTHQCATCTTHSCQENIARYIDTSKENPTDYFYEDNDQVLAYAGSNVARYTIDTLRLNRTQLVRLRHVRRFMDDWMSQLQQFLTESEQMQERIAEWTDHYNKHLQENLAPPMITASDSSIYLELIQNALELMGTLETQNQLMIQMEMNRLEFLQREISGEDE